MAFSTSEYLELRQKRLAQQEQAQKVLEQQKAQTDPERSKELESKPTWFQAGAFEDGYDFGDVSKTILAVEGEAEESVKAGIFGIGEKAVDTAAYIVGGVGGLFSDEFKQDTADFIAKDLYDERKLARAISYTYALNGLSDKFEAILPDSKYKELYSANKDIWLSQDVEADSVIGDKTESLLESGGQLAGTALLQVMGVPWWATTGTTSFGSEAENALNQGATYGEAGVSALVSAGAEMLTEKLFGGSGLGEKGLINLDKLTKGVSNKVVKTLLDYGVDMAAEGGEEVLSQVMNNLSSALYKEENLWQLLASEEAFQGYLDAFVGGMVLSGGMNVGKVANSVATQTDYRTGLTAQQQKVFDKAYSEALTQAQKDGTKLTGEQKRAIYDATLEAVKNGNVTGVGQVQQAESAQSGEAAAVQDSTQLPQQTAQQAKPGTLEYVMELAQSGGLTNKQAQAVVDQPDLYSYVLELAGFESPATASGKRNAVKQAVAQIAESQAAESTAAQQGSQAAQDGQILQTPTGTTQAQNSPQNLNARALGDNMAGANAGGVQADSYRLTSEDLPEYMQVGERRHVRDAKQKILDSGDSPILSKPAEIVAFIRNAFRGLIQKTVKAYGRVNSRLANAVKKATNGKINIDGYYLELDADRIAHIGDHVAEDKDTRNIPLTEAQLERLPEYIDTYDDLIQVISRKDGSVRLMLGKKINGHSIIIETVSKGRRSLHPVTAYQIDTEAYMKKYMTRAVDRSSTSRPANADTVDISRPATTLADSTIPSQGLGVNPQNVKADDSVGAAPAGFDPNSHLQYQYGTMPEHQNAVRPDDLPNRDANGNPISRVAGNIKGAKITPDAFVPLLDRMATGGELSYVSITNDATTQKAMEDIMRYGWEGSLAAWQKGVREGRAGADMTATGALLLNNAAQAGDKALWCDILADMQLLGTNTAQGLQAFKIIKQLAPSDKLYMIRRSVEQLAKDAGYDLQIDEGLARQYQEAKTDAEADKILDKIAKDVAGQIKTTWGEKWTAIRYLNMLGNFRTQIRNLSGNLTMGALNKAKNAVAVGIESIASKASGGKIQKTKSLTVSKEQLRSAMADYDTVADAISNGGRYNDPNAQRNAFMQKVQDNKQVFGFKPLEGYRKATSWAMEKGDAIFSKAAYARALAGYLKAKGITETDLSRIDPKIMDDARLYAVKEAQEVTFRDNNWLSTKLSQIGRGKDSNKWVKVVLDGILPFRKTPANVLIRAEQYSPLGFVNAVGNTVRAANGDISANAAIESWAKGLTGTGVFFLGMLLYNCGLLNAGPDDDEQKAAFDRMNGVQPYSLNIGGNTYTIDWASPAAVPLLMGGEFMKNVSENGLSLQALSDALASIADPMIEMSMLQGVNDTLEDVRYVENPLGQILINASLSYLTQGLTNTAAGQIERSFEDSRMQTYTDKNGELPDWLQKFIGKNSAKTPGWDYNQIPYINAWGEEEENMTPALGLVYNMLSPGYGDLKEDTPLTRELYRLDKAQGENVFPSTPGKSFKANGETVNMTAEQYVEAAKTKGQTQKRIVDEMISLPAYKALSDEDKAKAVRKAYEYAWDYTKQAVFDIEISTKWMRDIEGEEAEAILAWVQK